MENILILVLLLQISESEMSTFVVQYYDLIKRQILIKCDDILNIKITFQHLCLYLSISEIIIL